MKQPLHNERGIALIITLLVVAILTITVMEFTFSAHVDQVMGRNALYGLQATLLARSGINRGEAILLADQEPLYDSYLEDWGRIEELDSQLIIPDNMLLKVRVIDEMGKLNINKARPTNASQCQAFLSETPSMLGRMWIAALRNLDPQVATAATEYWTTVCENAPTTGQTGQPQATRTPTGQAAAPTPTPQGEETPGTQDWNSYFRDFPTLDDAAAGMGFSTAAVRRLRPYVTALPTLGGGGANKVNANTAPLRVLTAIIGDEAAAHDLITKRQDAPLTAGDISALSSAAATEPGEATTQPATMLGIVSSFYLVRASAIVNPNPTTGRGGIRRSASMLVQRRLRVGQSATAQSSGQGGPRRWTLTQLDWQKEGGAELFTEKREEETGGEDTQDSQFAAPMGG